MDKLGMISNKHKKVHHKDRHKGEFPWLQGQHDLKLRDKLDFTNSMITQITFLLRDLKTVKQDN